MFEMLATITCYCAYYIRSKRVVLCIIAHLISSGTKLEPILTNISICCLFVKKVVKRKKFVALLVSLKNDVSLKEI